MVKKWKKENEYQAYLVDLIENEILPGSIVLKNDPNYRQGIPDLSIFYGPYYAFLEVKRSDHEEEQPNQEYYINHFGQHTPSRFIYPENEREVLDEIQRAFRVSR